MQKGKITLVDVKSKLQDTFNKLMAKESQEQLCEDLKIVRSAIKSALHEMKDPDESSDNENETQNIHRGILIYIEAKFFHAVLQKTLEESKKSTEEQSHDEEGFYEAKEHDLHHANFQFKVSQSLYDHYKEIHTELFGPDSEFGKKARSLEMSNLELSFDDKIKALEGIEMEKDPLKSIITITALWSTLKDFKGLFLMNGLGAGVGYGLTLKSIALPAAFASINPILLGVIVSMVAYAVIHKMQMQGENTSRVVAVGSSVAGTTIDKGILQLVFESIGGIVLEFAKTFNQNKKCKRSESMKEFVHNADEALKEAIREEKKKIKRSASLPTSKIEYTDMPDGRQAKTLRRPSFLPDPL